MVSGKFSLPHDYALTSIRSPPLDPTPQPFAGPQLLPPACVNQQACLRSLARARRPQKDDVQRLAHLVVPRPFNPAPRCGDLAPAIALQFRFFQQIAILVRHHMTLDLCDRVDRHIDQDQQAGAAKHEELRLPGLPYKENRKEAELCHKHI